MNTIGRELVFPIEENIEDNYRMYIIQSRNKYNNLEEFN